LVPGIAERVKQFEAEITALRTATPGFLAQLDFVLKYNNDDCVGCKQEILVESRVGSFSLRKSDPLGFLSYTVKRSTSISLKEIHGFLTFEHSKDGWHLWRVNNEGSEKIEREDLLSLLFNHVTKPVIDGHDFSEARS